MIAAALWLPVPRLYFGENIEPYFQATGVPVKARRVLDARLLQWRDPALRARELGKIRAANPEWELMTRMLMVGALTNLALREEAKTEECLRLIDDIIHETLAAEKQHGFHHYLLSYSRGGYVAQGIEGSHFVDGEIALMLGWRRLLREDARFQKLFRERTSVIVERMRLSPIRSGESYPDEAWTFCNSIALAALRMAGPLDGVDHSELFREWVEAAREKLLEPKTGLFISSFHFDGAARDGPEGSSIWFVLHCLRLVDKAFAREQYIKARSTLGRSFLGFGYSREWPPGIPPAHDIDAGGVVPIFEAGPAASGLALVGAKSFEDREFFSDLMASVNMGAFPDYDSKTDTLRHKAINLMGDAVFAYAMLLGPDSDKVEAKSSHR